MNLNAMTTDAAPQSPDDPVERVESSAFVMITIIFTVVVAFAMVSLIYWRWYTSSEPASVVTVFSDAADDGTEIKVTQLLPTGEGEQSFESKLSSENDYRVTFFLEPGNYGILATPTEGRSPLKFEIGLHENRRSEFSLIGKLKKSAPKASTAPAQAPSRPPSIFDIH